MESEDEAHKIMKIEILKKKTAPLLDLRAGRRK